VEPIGHEYPSIVIAAAEIACVEGVAGVGLLLLEKDIESEDVGRIRLLRGLAAWTIRAVNSRYSLVAQ